MRVVFTRPFVDDYGRLNKTIASKVDKALRLLLSDRRHPSLHFKRIRSTPDVWEARVDRDYRMTLRIERDCYVMRSVGKHDETLGSP
jgi:mRNA-degrading endonuclease RelE of RelBE toxin-antitoxin system